MELTKRFSFKNSILSYSVCVFLTFIVLFVFNVNSHSEYYSYESDLYNNNYGRHCQHEIPKADEVVTGVHIEAAHVVKKRSATQPLRIALFYDHSVYRLDAEKFELINGTIMPEAVRFWEKTLMVRETGGPIKLNRKCPSRQVFVRGGRTHCIDACRVETHCGEVVVPEQHLNPCYICNKTGHDCRELSATEFNDMYTGPTTLSPDDSLTENAIVWEENPNDPIETVLGVRDADFVLYVSAVETERCRRGLTVAYAAHCQQEAALDRPIAGHANFCPSELSTRRQDLPSMLSTVQHEMLHALGFSVSLYAFYRDAEGRPLTERRGDTNMPSLNEELQIHQWSDRVVKRVTRKQWMVRGGYMSRTFNMMVTPRVLKEIRDHFNCSTLEGAELEDQGGEGTALTHWEKRVFENEAMTGTHTQSPVFSRITLALLEDTGWYRADYEQAQPLDWGRALGCQFATKSCKEWIQGKALKGKNPAPLCSRVKRDPLRTECAPRRTAVALCNLVRHEAPLPRMYQHFDYLKGVRHGEELLYGGSVSLADYCPYLQEFTWRAKSVVVRGSRCSYKENTPSEEKNFALEGYGEHSKCFEHTDQMWEQRSCRQLRQWQHWGSGCYEYKCEHGQLHIIVANFTYICYHAEQVLRIRILRDNWLHRGTIVCPPCREVCGPIFAARRQSCKPGDEAPPPNQYHQDELPCAASEIRTSLFLIAFTFVLTHYAITTR